MTPVKRVMESLDYNGLHKLLAEDSSLANAGLPYDAQNTVLAHPLHRICDGVFSGTYRDDQGVELAKIFLEHGADINGFGLEKGVDTPLTAAASLHAEEVGILYVDRGADIHHASAHGGTALHWAAWTGCDQLVDRLIKAGADIHLRCIDFSATPLFWGVHGYKFSGGRNRRHQISCVRLLLAAGAERDVSNKEGTPVGAFLDPEDIELKTIFS
jgi:uncharacterized protein